jgi:hypothetical protein
MQKCCPVAARSLPHPWPHQLHSQNAAGLAVVDSALSAGRAFVNSSGTCLLWSMLDAAPRSSRFTLQKEQPHQCHSSRAQFKCTPIEHVQTIQQDSVCLQGIYPFCSSDCPVSCSCCSPHCTQQHLWQLPGMLPLQNHSQVQH